MNSLNSHLNVGHPPRDLSDVIHSGLDQNEAVDADDDDDQDRLQTQREVRQQPDLENSEGRFTGQQWWASTYFQGRGRKISVSLEDDGTYFLDEKKIDQWQISVEDSEIRITQKSKNEGRK